ncbi:MAG: hypothetical protein GXP48_04650 [Acidobacteria bacterium]|nr:hypothetical protein [Acidobacteriota bacterium]
MVIPDFVLSLMWEYDMESLSAVDQVPDAVIERVMARGGIGEMRWLLDAVPVERLRTYLKTRGMRALPPRELRFWSWITGIPEPEASGWVQMARKREALWRS